jgi:soluble lytic murein transglycosylase-like protein
MNHISYIESSNNTKAYNQHSKAVGLYQIAPICLKDYNQYHKLKYTTKELYNGNINYTIANWYMNKRIPKLLKHYNINDTVNNRLIAYNAGINYLRTNKQLPTETINYIDKYNRLANKQ